jgi:hypothetical protein
VKAICVNADSKLEVRDVPTPTDPPSGHLIVDIEYTVGVWSEQALVRERRG